MGLRSVTAGMVDRAVHLWKVEKLRQRTRSGPAEDLLAQHWRAAYHRLNGDTEIAADLVRSALLKDNCHVDGPLAVHAELEGWSPGTADDYIKWYIGQRDALSFEQLDNYVTWLRTSRYVDFPLIVQLETLTLCNAACTFCQYPDLTRKGDKMPDDLVHRIVADLKRAMPADLPFTFTLYGVSEPFLDKRIFSHIELINRELPQAQIGINTNGAPLTDANIERLSGLKIAWMGVSVNDYRKEHYERTMKLPFDRTLKVLDKLQARRADGTLQFNVGLTRAGDGSIEDLRFIQWVKRIYPALTCNFTPQFVWVGEDTPREGVAPAIGCAHWFEVAVRANGRVSFCCIDGHIEQPRGDLNSQEIIALYNEPSFRDLRTRPQTRRDIDVCRNCSSG